jgi:hypothetical protein
MAVIFSMFVSKRLSMPPLRNPIAADLAQSGPAVTKYDEEHAVTYICMLEMQMGSIGASHG